MFIKQVLFTKQNTKQKFTNTLCFQNKTNVYNTNVYKTKVYKHVMFIKQNSSLHTSYVYKTSSVYKTKYKTKVYKHVMFTKQNKYLQHKCLQNKSLQNKNKTIRLQTRYVFKTKQNEKQNKNKMFKALCNFTTFSVVHRDHFVNFTDF